MTYNHDEFGHFFIVLDNRINKELFINLAGGKENSFSSDIFSRMYDSVFSELINLEEMYEKYYKIEYSSFEQFLYKKYCVPAETIDEMKTLTSKRESYQVFFKKSFYAYGDYGITRFVFSDDMYEKVMNILLLKDYES